MNSAVVLTTVAFVPSKFHKEFILIDESGDPGAEGNPIYILIALHADEEALHEVRQHLTAFRYHLGATKEFKSSRWADRPLTTGNALDRLLTPIANLVDEERVTVTANWLNKETYKGNGGPYLTGATADTAKFRNFQLRLLLERHVLYRGWGPATDLVIDRWAMTEEQRRNLEDYLRNNFNLRPVPWITLVDSVYCDFVQVVDVVSRVVRRCVEDRADDDERGLCSRLTDLHEVTRGLY